MSKVRFLFAAFLTAMLLATAGVASASTSAAPPKLRVAVFGDSLSVESRDYVSFLSASSNMQIDFFVFGGTAPCDWYSQMRTAKASGKYKVVVTAWAGNQNTPCSKGNEFTMYDKMIRTEKQIWGKTPLVLMVAPAPAPGAESFTQVSTARAVIRWTGTALGLKVYDPQPLFLNGAGVSGMTSPCIPGEACANIPDPTTGAMSNPVRNADGLHFCPPTAAYVPTGNGLYDGSHPLCNGYASGAMRYASGIIAAIKLGAGL